MEVPHISRPSRLVAVSIWWLLMLGSVVSICYGDEVDEHLKRLNKPPLKTIQSSDGDIIDCVHISKQPAFDHPSLNPSSIQMMPSYIPEGHDNGKNESIKQTWHSSGMCEEGTIPIRRTKREDLLRAMTIQSFGKKQHKSVRFNAPPADNFSQHEHAVAYVVGQKYYGAKATIDLWAPKVQLRTEFSLSQLWILGGYAYSDINTIEAGWQVYPYLYGDYRPRLFIYWTSDYYQKTGCYNLMCSGFIQTSNKVAIGGAMPVSTYQGLQYDVTIFVWKDKNQGNWWLRIGKYVIGYWPSSLFTHLNTYADVIEWGGEIVNLASGGYHTTTQMGSGHFPREGYRRASYFNNIQIVDGTNTLWPAKRLRNLTDTSRSCYDIQIGAVPISGWGSYFYYGGPGRNSACP